jgi:DNA-binding transcriptional regulator YiaG
MVATGAVLSAKNEEQVSAPSRRRSWGTAQPLPSRSAGSASGTTGQAMAEGTDVSGLRPDYGIGALARRLGVASATLRDWERRYGIGPSGRTAGGHRRYRPDDVARIEYMRRLVLDGVPPGEAARVALAAEPPPDAGRVSAPESAGVSAPESAGVSAPEPGRVPGPEPGRVADAANRGPDLATWGAGGRSLRLPDQLPQARGLARAALALDALAIARLLERSLDQSGVLDTWDQMAAPVLVAIGERYAATGSCVDVEHLLSTQVLTALAARAGQLSEPLNSRPVLLACADDEQHSLPLYALAAALAERRVGSRMLGARTPPAALAEAVSRIGPAAAFIWSQSPETANPAQLAALPRQRPPLRLLVAGPGWQGVPPGARQVTTLTEAVQQACAAVGVA